MHGLWGLGQMMFTKYLVVVDGGVDVHNTGEVLFRLCAIIGPQRACRAEALEGRTASSLKGLPTSSTTRSAKSPSAANSALMRRVKLPGEGFKRPWPRLIRMDDVAKDRRCAALLKKFGLDR